MIVRWLGDKKEQALQVPCDSDPAQRRGKALIVSDKQNLDYGQVDARGIADDAVTAAKVQAYRDIIFGGSCQDGEGNFDGVKAVSGASLAGSTYTLSRDVSYTRAIVYTGVTVVTAGYKLQAREFYLKGTAVVNNDGEAGISSTDQFGGAKTTGQSNHSVGGSQGGGKGGDGGNIDTAGDPGDPGDSQSTSMGGSGHAGSAGASVPLHGAGGALGAAGIATAPTHTPNTRSLDNFSRLLDLETLTRLLGGAGGGGGGGGGGSGSVVGGGGGSGGAGGGVCLVVCDVLDVTGWTGRISANGGTGGSGHVSAAGDGGNGGGGGGGFVQVAYRVLRGGTLTSGSNVTAAGGTGGAGAGNAGTVVIYDVGTPYVGLTEMGRGVTDSTLVDEDEFPYDAVSSFFVKV